MATSALAAARPNARLLTDTFGGASHQRSSVMQVFHRNRLPATPRVAEAQADYCGKGVCWEGLALFDSPLGAVVLGAVPWPSP